MSGERLLKLPAMLVECTCLAVSNDHASLLREGSNFPRFRRRERAGARQNQYTITSLEQLSLLHLAVCNEIVLQAKVFNQPAPGLAQPQEVILGPLGACAQLCPGVACVFVCQKPLGSHAGLR